MSRPYTWVLLLSLLLTACFEQEVRLELQGEGAGTIQLRAVFADSSGESLQGRFAQLAPAERGAALEAVLARQWPGVAWEAVTLEVAPQAATGGTSVVVSASGVFRDLNAVQLRWGRAESTALLQGFSFARDERGLATLATTCDPRSLASLTPSGLDPAARALARRGLGEALRGLRLRTVFAGAAQGTGFADQVGPSWTFEVRGDEVLGNREPGSPLRAQATWLAAPAEPGFAARLARAERAWQAGAEARAVADARLRRETSHLSNKNLDSTSTSGEDASKGQR